MTAVTSDIPPLCFGDRLSRHEFERRYESMPECKKAELIEGVVHLQLRVPAWHGRAHAQLCTWLGSHDASSPQVASYDNATLRLDLDNEPQPDLLLRILPECGGTCRVGAGDLLEGAPELVVEVTATSASYDLHSKLHVYRRNGVREYLVWRVLDGAVDWFVLRGSVYERLSADREGVMRSEVFPGLWLDVPKLIADDMAAVLRRLGEGLAHPDHAAFVARLLK